MLQFFMLQFFGAARWQPINGGTAEAAPAHRNAHKNHNRFYLADSLRIGARSNLQFGAALLSVASGIQLCTIGDRRFEGDLLLVTGSAARARTSEDIRSSEPDSAALRGQYVYTRVRSEIANGSLRPGDRIREVALAERLAVSRTPVREALKRLQSEGLIVFAPPRGLIVADLSPREVMEIMSVREVLEGAAARFAAELASPLEVESLKHIHGQEPPRDPDEAALRDKLFHDALGVAAHNDYLLKAMNSLRDALTSIGTANYSVPGRMEKFWREHNMILDAIVRRNPDAAEKAARQHIREAIQVRLRLMFGSKQDDQPKGRSRAKR